MAEKITKAEFARRMGFTPQYVNKLLKQGILIPDSDGKMDFEKNKKLHDANKKVGYNRANDVTVEAAAQSGIDYNTARTKKEIARARLTELELEELQGKLVRIDDVRADAANVGGELRVKLQSIAPRIATVCEGKEARQIERIIADEINKVLEVLQNSRFS